MDSWWKVACEGVQWRQHNTTIQLCCSQVEPSRSLSSDRAAEMHADVSGPRQSYSRRSSTLSLASTITNAGQDRLGTSRLRAAAVLHGLSGGDFVPALLQFLGTGAGSPPRRITD